MLQSLSLYLIPFLHQTTTLCFTKCQNIKVVSYSISTSNHNTKDFKEYIIRVVSYSISTSNHNKKLFGLPDLTLYLIPFLHQTTTVYWKQVLPGELYLIPFLHQTTTIYHAVPLLDCCILFHFYIKPQLRRAVHCFQSKLYLIPFLHQTTTNWGFTIWFIPLYLIPFLHQTTTGRALGLSL